MLLAVDLSSSLMLLMKILVRRGSDMNPVPLLNMYNMDVIPMLGDIGISSTKSPDRVTPRVMLLRLPIRLAIPAAAPLDIAIARLETRNKVPMAADSTPNFTFK